MIQLENICKTYTVKTLKQGKLLSYNKKEIHALSDVSFSVAPGESVGYVGLNGSGKSTTIKILAGILNADSGRIRVNGRDPFLDKEHRKTIGAVFGQHQQLWIDLPVQDSFQMLRYIYSVPKEEFSRRLQEINSFLNLEPLLAMPSRKLSLGQRMKCEFAASLLHGPKLLLLDEPTIGIDIQTRKSVMDLITHLNRQYGVTIFLTTHNLPDIETVCGKIIIIDGGSVIYQGDQAEFLKANQDIKKLHVETAENINAEQAAQFSTPVCSVSGISGNKLEITYPSDQIGSALDLVNRIRQTYRVQAIAAQERSLENVINDLYEKTGR